MNFLSFDSNYAALAVYRSNRREYSGIFYASYLDDINKTADSSLVSLVEHSQSQEDKSAQSDQNISSAWAEVFLVLESGVVEDYALFFMKNRSIPQHFIPDFLMNLTKVQWLKISF